MPDFRLLWVRVKLIICTKKLIIRINFVFIHFMAEKIIKLRHIFEKFPIFLSTGLDYKKIIGQSHIFRKNRLMGLYGPGLV